MKQQYKYRILLLVLMTIFTFSCTQSTTKNEIAKQETEVKNDPLPSWNEGSSKKAMIDFVTKTTNEGGADFVPVADRIACFDNDGTLWSEQPLYFQFFFAIEQIKAMAPQHPEWKDNQPFKAILEGDMKTVMGGGEKALLQILKVSHADMTTEAFSASVKNWIKTAKHPKTGKLYKDMVYQPMLELLAYLRAHEYKTFIVSGGGMDFIRPWAEEVYGIPPYQVIGSSGKVKYEVIDGKPQLVKLPELNFNDDKEGKPVGIHQYIGKRPVFIGGNSDGDYAMLEWATTQTSYKSFGLIVHHTDEVREYAYDRTSSIGKLEKGLDDASKYNWLVVDMKADWKTIYKN
jgi:phosphoglycolate phosphatase-like HAD superfamily hydrolase